MRFIATISLLLALHLLIPTHAFSKAGPKIPTPQHTASEAIEIVEAVFRKSFPDGRRFAEGPGLMIKDFFVQSAVYASSFDEISFGEWSWLIKFVHPVHNDNSFVFRLKNNGEVILLRQTE